MLQKQKTKRVRYRECEVKNDFWEFVKNYKAPGNIGGSSCYFNVAIRFFTSFPHLSDALSRWSGLNGGIKVLTKNDLKALTKKGKKLEEVWLSFFKTLQSINKSKNNEDVSGTFEILYLWFCKISGLGPGQQSTCEAIRVLKEKFEEYCCEKGQNLSTCARMSCSFSCEGGDFAPNSGTEQKKAEFSTDPFLGEKYKPDGGLEKVFIDEIHSDAYSFSFSKKKYSDIVLSERMFLPHCDSNGIKKTKIKFKNDRDEIVDVGVGRVNLEEISTTKMNNNKYGLAVFGNHSGTASGGHYVFEAFRYPGKTEDIFKYDDSNIIKIKDTSKFVSHVTPVMYVKQDIKKDDKLSCFFTQEKEELDDLFQNENFDDIITEELKEEFVDLATKIETEKIKKYREIVKKIISYININYNASNLPEEFNKGNKNSLLNSIPEVFYNDSIPIKVSFKPEKGEGEGKMNDNNNVFSLSDRKKINTLSGMREIGRVGIIPQMLNEIYKNKTGIDIKDKDMKYILGPLKDINQMSLEPGEENFKIAVEKLHNEANRLMRNLRGEFGLNFFTDIPDKDSHIKIPSNTTNPSNVTQNITPPNVIDPPNVIIDPPVTQNVAPLHTPTPGEDGTKTQNQTTSTQEKNSSINTIKKSTDDSDRKKKDNTHNKNNSSKDEEEKTKNNFITTDDGENKTSKPPEITIIDILLCLLIIGIFIIIYKLIEQNKYNKIKNGGGNGGNNYNLNDTHEKQKNIDYF